MPITDPDPLIQAPKDPAEWPAWRDDLAKWRAEHASAEIKNAYDHPEFAWMRPRFLAAKVMLFDREFYDPVSNRFKVEPYVDRLRKEFGGLDVLVLWQAYPRIGFDSRNQFDHYRLAPDLKGAVDRLHRLGVKVFLAYNPWDTGTRREPGPDSESLDEMVREFGFDGVFLDTLKEGDAALRKALDGAKPGVVMESELDLPVSAMAANHASWAQWFDDSEAPGVMRNHWLEPRHMMHTIRRWDLDHTGEIHMAWMNGAGILVWENIFGSYNPWDDRDRAILRSSIAVRRRFDQIFEKGTWEPLVPCPVPNVYASRWVLDGTELWTLTNRSYEPASGPALPVSSDGQVRLFDLIRGVELDHGHIELSPRSTGAVLAIPRSRADHDFETFLKSQATLYSPQPSRRHDLRPVRTPIPESRTLNPGSSPQPKGPNSGSVAVAAGPRTVASNFRCRECGEYGYGKFLDPNGPPLHSTVEVKAQVNMRAFALDRREVTNREFQEFLARSSYRPRHRESFLAHWVGGKSRQEDLDEPVTFIDIDDARAYALWAGKRLPTEYEWQVGVAEHDLPHGAVWNWTESEHFDDHTRFSILKGGCKWKAVGSDWYADSGPHDSDWSAKFIHFFPALDRCETIGFRCGADL